MSFTGFTLASSAGNVVEPSTFDVTGSANIVVGDILQIDFAAESGALARRPASTLGPISLFGVAASGLTSATGRIKVIPIVPGQLWHAGCANNTSVEHVLKRHKLSDHDIIANTAQDESTSLGIFLMYAAVGAASEKKCIGEFIRIPQQLVAKVGQSADNYI